MSIRAPAWSVEKASMPMVCSRSKMVTAYLRESKCAAVRPAMPEPTTAISLRPPGRDARPSRLLRNIVARNARRSLLHGRASSHSHLTRTRPTDRPKRLQRRPKNASPRRPLSAAQRGGIPGGDGAGARARRHADGTPPRDQQRRLLQARIPRSASNPGPACTRLSLAHLTLRLRLRFFGLDMRLLGGAPGARRPHRPHRAAPAPALLRRALPPPA